MNRTEHQLRMSFDPEYREKWEVLVEARKLRRGDLRESFINCMFWTVLFFVIFRNPWSLLTTPVLYLLVSWVYCLHLDRVMRRGLGL